ncbi:MAG: hypothetical protein EP319_18490 [Deltaproteobacteria bacterium]|nr:MAG: hypothetical protein EP319_18490 [Deltaproteobacteria bacterium]
MHILLFLLFSSCSQLNVSQSCTEKMNPEKLNKLGKQHFSSSKIHDSKKCYKFSCYQKDFEGCYQYATLIGYENKAQSQDLLNLICDQGFKKACPSKYTNTKIYPRDSEKSYTPNEQSSLRSWAKLLGKTLERNVNSARD